MKKLFLLLILSWVLPAHAMNVHTAISMIDCESSGRYNAVGDDGKSFGIAQFQKATFNMLKAKAHMPELRWKNPIHQMRLMVWAVDHGYGHHWTCYSKIQHKTQPPPIELRQDTQDTQDTQRAVYVVYPARKDLDYNELIDYN
jgi:hypothetical protein